MERLNDNFAIARMFSKASTQLDEAGLSMTDADGNLQWYFVPDWAAFEYMKENGLVEWNEERECYIKKSTGNTIWLVSR